MRQTITPTAGLDVGKLTLDLALTGRAEVTRLDNTPEGHATLIATLREHAVWDCPDTTDTHNPSDPTIPARRREIVAEHLLFTTLRFLTVRHAELLNALEESVGHLGDPPGGGHQDDEAVRDIARRFIGSLRTEART